MKVRIWLTLVDGADRVYIQSTLPGEGWLERIRGEGGEVYVVDVDIPGKAAAIDLGTAYATQVALHSEMP